jgi:hypothetical protein
MQLTDSKPLDLTRSEMTDELSKKAVGGIEVVFATLEAINDPNPKNFIKAMTNIFTMIPALGPLGSVLTALSPLFGGTSEISEIKK